MREHTQSKPFPAFYKLFLVSFPTNERNKKTSAVFVNMLLLFLSVEFIMKKYHYNILKSIEHLPEIKALGIQFPTCFKGFRVKQISNSHRMREHLLLPFKQLLMCSLHAGGVVNCSALQRTDVIKNPVKLYGEAFFQRDIDFRLKLQLSHEDTMQCNSAMCMYFISLECC